MKFLIRHSIPFVKIINISGVVKIIIILRNLVLLDYFDEKRNIVNFVATWRYITKFPYTPIIIQ